MKKYRQAAETMRKWLKQGRYLPGDKLPPFLKLAEILGVTDQTARKAVALLVAEGLVYVRNGVGIFVCEAHGPKLKIMVLSDVGETSEQYDFRDFIGIEVYKGVLETIKLKRFDYSLSSVLVYENKPRRLYNKFKNEQIDGVITWCPEGDELVDYIADLAGYHRVVSASHGDLAGRFNRLSVDFSEALDSVFKRAYELGHRRFAMLYGTNFTTKKSHLERFRRFMKFCYEYGIYLSPSSMLETEGDSMDGYRAASRLLDGPDKITAIFVATDQRAKGVIQALRDRNLTPGKEVSVIGFDGMPGIEDWDLTTIEIPRRQMGHKAVELIHQAINTKARREHIVFKGKPVYRGSLGAVQVKS